MKTPQIKIITITTPKHYQLRGLLFGSERAETIFVYLHGYSGNIFSQSDFLESLVDSRTAVLTFSNRGHGIINNVAKVNPRRPLEKERIIAGAAHEVFTDCVDDIAGAVSLAKSYGAKNVYLLGHSTGCQKSAYYLAKKNDSAVKGAILLAPMSDYADTVKFTDKKVYSKALACARKMVKAGQSQDLLPSDVWQMPCDAQRWLSLYTPDSVEEIFSYASERKPVTLLKNKKPTLYVLAENDQYTDRPIAEIADWFKDNLKGRPAEVQILAGAPHNFYGSFEPLKKMMQKWLKKD